MAKLAKHEPRNVSGQIIVSEQSFSGPLPAPADLQKYEEVIPGAAERIIAMAEREQQNRHERETTLTKNAVSISRLGQIFGFVIIVLLIAAATFSLYLGFPYIAGGIFTVTILGVAHVFVLRQKGDNSPSGHS